MSWNKNFVLEQNVCDVNLLTTYKYFISICKVLRSIAVDRHKLFELHCKLPNGGQ